MNPFALIGIGLLFTGKKGKRKKARAGARTVRAGKRRRRVPKPQTKRGNGKIKQIWTSFPWKPDRVNDVAQELLAKGESDPERLTLAVAKTVYPVYPVSGMEFPWPPETRDGEVDVGATAIYKRIRLRVNTLLADMEEQLADEATAHMESEEDDEDEEDQNLEEEAGEESEEDEEEEEEEEEEPEKAEPSPRIGRASPQPQPTPQPESSARRPLTLRRKRVMRRRPDPFSYHPQDNHIGHGLFHRVEDGETVHGIARAALSAMGEPTDQDVAQYVSLLVCSPANDLPTVWDEEHELPGTEAAPWGDEHPTLWLPKLNEASLGAGVVTTLGVTWPDGSNGITPPAGMMGRDG